MKGFMAGVFDVLKTAEHNQNSAIRPEQETSQDSLFVLVLVTTARIFRSRVRSKVSCTAVRCSSGGVGDHPTDYTWAVFIVMLSEPTQRSPMDWMEYLTYHQSNGYYALISPHGFTPVLKENVLIRESIHPCLS